jgi:hypothetical protein
LLETSWVQLDKTLFPPWHLLEVVDDSIGSKVLVLKDSNCEVVAQENNWDIVDDGDVVLVDNHVVDCGAGHGSSFSDVSWINPGSLNLNWMMMGDLKTSNLTQLSL